MDNLDQDCCECGPGCGDCQSLADCAGDEAGDLIQQLVALRRRVDGLEAVLQMVAKRRICALMTDVDALERYVLERDVTTADLKKAGLRAMGLDRKG